MNASGFGPGGIPGWLEPILHHCTRCGCELVFGPVPGEERARLACPDCGQVCYVNPRLVVTALPVTESGEVVLIRRAIEPGRGLWAQPGGFLEIDETAPQAAVRETLEETGLLVEPGRIVGLYSRLTAAVVVVAYEARIVSGEAGPSAEALEAQAFAPERIPWGEVAFETSVRALRDWVAAVRPDVAVPDDEEIERAFGS